MKTKVFLVCSGLGHIRRGFESFTQECFDALRYESGIDITLFRGAGKSSGREKTLWNLPRSGAMCRFISHLLRSSSYKIEQVTFTLSLLPYLIAEKPEVVVFSDGSIGNILWHYRRYSGQKFSLLFSNGGPLDPPFPRWDYIQQVSPEYYDRAAKCGVAPAKQTLLPYGFDLPSAAPSSKEEHIRRLRTELGLPIDRKILVSIGAINASHKRMDYLVRELASLPEPRPFLLLLGEATSETEDIRSLAVDQLGREHFALLSVSKSEVPKYLRASDIFILASLQEGFGRVVVEAMAQGLPCIVHDYPTSRFILQDFGIYGDLRQKGNLTTLLRETIPAEVGLRDRDARCAYVYRKFSWTALRTAYVTMIQTAAANAFGSSHIRQTPDLSESRL